MATVTIDGIRTAAPDGSTILDAADRAGISIPTL
ncbi:MAG: 2Fe-2S iron-sulfur cluster-binding protein [Spirochaetaceae bacterium]